MHRLYRVDRCRVTTENAYLRLFLAHRAALVDYAVPIVGCRAHAEDVVQEAYIRFSAVAKSPRGEAIIHPTGYLYRIVRNLALDWARRLIVETALPETDQLNALSAEVPTAEQALLYRDELRVLAEALAELPERTRVAFNMHRLEGRTLQEVAEVLGVSVVRAHQLVKQAVLHGARKLDEHDSRRGARISTERP